MENKLQEANKISHDTQSPLQRITQTQAEKASLQGVIASLSDLGSLAPTRYPSDAILEKLRTVSDTSQWSTLSRFGPTPDAVVECFHQQTNAEKKSKVDVETRLGRLSEKYESLEKELRKEKESKQESNTRFAAKNQGL
jgi:hypothetical protein